MASTPSFVSTPRADAVAISTANTNRDGTGTLGTVLTGSADGTRILQVDVKATGTTTAGMVRLFLHDGSTAYLLKEVAVTALTPSATVKGFHAVVEFENVLLPDSDWSLRASTHNAETFNVFAFGGDLT